MDSPGQVMPTQENLFGYLNVYLFRTLITFSKSCHLCYIMLSNHGSEIGHIHSQYSREGNYIGSGHGVNIVGTTLKFCLPWDQSYQPGWDS